MFIAAASFIVKIRMIDCCKKKTLDEIDNRPLLADASGGFPRNAGEPVSSQTVPMCPLVVRRISYQVPYIESIDLIAVVFNFYKNNITFLSLSNMPGRYNQYIPCRAQATNGKEAVWQEGGNKACRPGGTNNARARRLGWAGLRQAVFLFLQAG